PTATASATTPATTTEKEVTTPKAKPSTSSTRTGYDLVAQPVTLLDALQLVLRHGIKKVIARTTTR
ncbi:hypothetical protein, partial [Rhodovibrio sodomensis]|uniref:hypothetical protein n=1 Tax=Rhodovibrio sodomensis TaxID=1088 RepID=UPI001A911C26